MEQDAKDNVKGPSVVQVVNDQVNFLRSACVFFFWFDGVKERYASPFIPSIISSFDLINDVDHHLMFN